MARFTLLVMALITMASLARGQLRKSISINLTQENPLDSILTSTEENAFILGAFRGGLSQKLRKHTPHPKKKQMYAKLIQLSMSMSVSTKSPKGKIKSKKKLQEYNKNLFYNKKLVYMKKQVYTKTPIEDTEGNTNEEYKNNSLVYTKVNKKNLYLKRGKKRRREAQGHRQLKQVFRTIAFPEEIFDPESFEKRLVKDHYFGLSCPHSMCTSKISKIKGRKSNSSKKSKKSSKKNSKKNNNKNNNKKINIKKHKKKRNSDSNDLE